MSNDSRAPQAAAPVRRAELKDLAIIGAVLVVLLGLCGLLAGYVAPAVVSDWSVRSSAVPVRNANVSGTCSGKLFFFVCDPKLSATTPQGRVTRDPTLMFVGFHSGRFSVQVLADPARPDQLTSDLALDHLWNRTVVLILALLLVGVPTAVILYAFLVTVGRVFRGT